MAAGRGLKNNALDYAIRKVEANQEGLISNGANQLLAYVNDINLLGENIHSIQKNTVS